MTRKTKKSQISKELEAAETVAVVYALAQTRRDMVHSVLVVSVFINLVFFIAWLALQVTTVYDTEVATLLFTR